ncbi:class I SAM-dependent methyltransferase [filamentous cyanobacterium LEGE 11480]|uniref:Class I SAM-dependent methyltransferase n=1 Tax=Romeriopsis navalis LEGE 11480 TaxID=2777977 RepID=A0A928VP83_9CYAN|nr:class I SAM-dependent methyltransferase [Romeriopsis navalis]MBE9029529.1 class I SAM-dependent methyltransferase [Romeriopsis navalis LEGE 11480]
MSNLPSSVSPDQFWDNRYINSRVDLERFWHQECENSNKIPDNREFKEIVDFFGDLNGARVLDLGCGEGRTSLFLAAHGANVTAVDISAVAVDRMNTFCRDCEIKNIQAMQSSALDLASLGQFDFVVGFMILHHIEPFEEFAKVLADTLKSGGKAFFYENNAFSDLLMWFREHIVGRLWIPKGGDDDEFPLLPAEVNLFRQYLNVDVIYPRMVFVQLFSQYILKGRLLTLSLEIDKWLFKLKFVRKYSYRQYVMLEKRKDEK